MPDPVMMYLDPGTGATLAQIALAGTAGIAAAAKLRMNRLRRKTDSAEPEDERQAEEVTEETATAE